MVDYQKLYAYLIGQVDETILFICDKLLKGEHGFEELILILD